MNNINKYIFKFLYSLAGVLMVLIGLIPMIIFVCYILWLLFEGIKGNFLYLLQLIPLTAVVIAFGSKMMDFIENMFGFSSKLINKIKL
jgi:hypothetical protein